MARSQSPVFNKGTLNLDRVTGVRKDSRSNRFIDAPIKQEVKLKESPRSMKASSNLTTDGLKKS
jgi:uncharacterized Fe-S cluster-containing protein